MNLITFTDKYIEYLDSDEIELFFCFLKQQIHLAESEEVHLKKRYQEGLLSLEALYRDISDRDELRKYRQAVDKWGEQHREEILALTQEYEYLDKALDAVCGWCEKSILHTTAMQTEITQ